MTFTGMEMEGQSQNWSSPRLDRVVTGSLVGWLAALRSSTVSPSKKFHWLNFSLRSLTLSLTHTHTRANSLSYHGISCLHSPLQTHTLSHANMWTHILSFSHTHIYSFSHSFLRTLPLFHKHTLTVASKPIAR